MKMAADSLDLSPYNAPRSVSDTPVVRRPRTSTLLRFVIGLQSIVIVASLAIEAYHHASIIGSGPIFSIVGVVIAILALRSRDPASAVFGVSALFFSSLIVFLINYNSWGPPQGDRPITILSYVYAALALPSAIWLVLARSKSSGNHPMQTSGESGIHDLGASRRAS